MLSIRKINTECAVNCFLLLAVIEMFSVCDVISCCVIVTVTSGAHVGGFGYSLWDCLRHCVFGKW